MYWQFLFFMLVIYALLAYLIGVEIEDLFSSMLLYLLGYIQGGINKIKDSK